MIRQSKYLFIGGPWDGLWRSVGYSDGTYRVSSRSITEPDKVSLYHAQRMVVPGWFVPLTIYTTDPLLAPGMGTVLPGLVQGARPDMTPAGPWRYLDNDEARYGEATHDAIRERRYRP